MDPQPTFTLPACPVCSSVFTLERPHWHHAKNTSRARKVECYAFIGCKHVEALGLSAKMRSDPEEWALVEEQWKLAVDQLFAEHTTGWPDAAAKRHRRILDDKMSFLPGTVDPLNLTPATPAQPEQHEPTKE